MSINGVFWILPFIAFISSLAFLPLFKEEFWHKYDAHIVFLACFSIILPFIFFEGIPQTTEIVKKTLFYHYIPFLLLISCLFTISGGIHFTVAGKSTPLKNVFFLLGGSLLANLIGTTGASMLLIRPFLNLNHNRHYKSYLVIFFIFTVSNIGGCLTPIGDPPLFLGFLEGIHFFWPLSHLFKPFLMVFMPVLGVFYLIDRHYYRSKLTLDLKEHSEKFKIYGKRNIFLLFVMLSLLLGTSLHQEAYQIYQNIGLIILALLSYIITPKSIHYMNRLSFMPLREVGLVFLAIFITLIPIEIMLHQGMNGPLSGLIGVVNPKNAHDPLMYYLFTGSLSSFLDNAPTYLLFFHTAGGDPDALMGLNARTLIAISTGSVFWGALTYIGNAPNFMVKSISERLRIRMPSFLGYMGWSFGILLPILLIFGLYSFR